MFDLFYRLLLFAFSATMRRRWGKDMAELVRDQMDDARSRGESRAKVFWLAVGDGLLNGLGERLSAGRKRWAWRRGTARRNNAMEKTAWMAGFSQDVRFAVRQFTRQPATALATILVLALGIGANTAVFSVLDGVLLRPLPLPHADRLVRVFSDVPSFGVTGATLPGFQDWAREKGPFEALGAFYPSVHNLTGRDLPERIIVGSTVGDFWGAAGLAAAIGRTYGPSDGSAPSVDSGPVILLTDRFWRRSFAAEPGVVGQTIELDGEQALVLGILPVEEGLLRFGRDIDAWAPMGEPLLWMGRGTNFLTVLGRVRSGLTPETAAEPLGALASGLIEAGTTDNGIVARSLRDGLVGDARTLLWGLQGAALLLMLVVAANAANLSLARSLDRSAEFAVRTALGAGRLRIARQVLAETTLLGLLGGIAGLGLAVLGRSLVMRTIPDLAALAGPAALSRGVLAYTFGTALGVGVLAGLWPAIRATTRTWSTLKTGGRSISGARRGGRALVAIEIGLALVLLVSAGLMVRTLSSLLGEELGFRPGGALTARITLPEASYPEWRQRHQFFEQLVERIRALPGVEAAALTSALPLRNVGDSGTFQIEGRAWPDGTGPDITKKAASAGYFATMGIPVVAGREFSWQDRADAPLVAMVSESMARRFFPGEEPLGQKIRLGWWGNEFAEIVGVVGDVKQSGREQGAEIAGYLPQTQIGAPDATIVIRTAGDPSGLANLVRMAVLALDPNQPIFAVTTLADVVSDSLTRQTSVMSLLIGLALIALVISCFGIYAVTAQAVRGRSEEFGIRMTLGATGNHVASSVLLTEGKVIAIGILLGVVATAATTSIMESLLFGVSRLDALTLAASGAALGSVALFAALGPAIKASRTDPIGVLRQDS